ncbi:Y-family DNA polymerase [Hephaestia mangrovi]|uniref:Y-family DNA polymerase n=1 Tax=Hephaestia mangrovi TaxID=2873268 RepID=UPI001CA6EAAB|nr:DNA polymerase Y family protein [Hephaestia mangrovi]MBY8826653.1 DNA polymerase Y family protein [Hephaestia mangrovi]
MPPRRYWALWFPWLSTDRLRRGDEGAPLALIEKQRGAMRLVAVDAAAAALGLAPGLSLADARARVPDFAVADHDPHADARLLARLADGCDRYTPMVATDLFDGLTLDVTGCAHVFGGEAGMAGDLARLATHWRVTVRHAFADTPEAAQALARYGTGEDDLQALPVAALRCDEEIVTALTRAGLRTIGDLAQRPTAPLTARFGEETTSRLARLLGRADSRITPRRTLPALRCERRFAEPIARTADVLTVIADLAREAVATMERRGKGGRRFAIRLFRSDGDIRDLAIETGQPARDAGLVQRLFAERIDALADPIDPGFGFDLVRLAVPVLEPLAPTQLHLEGGEVSDGELLALIDRLSIRLGRGRVQRLVPRDTHIPEQAALALPAIEAPVPEAWPAPPPGEPPLRPLHLFDPPQAIEVTAEVPDGPPRQFRWRRSSHNVIRYEGPERIAAEWWKRDDNAGLTRDYYRIEDTRGRRFWVFRHGLYRESGDPRWYVHGLFA